MKIGRVVPEISSRTDAPTDSVTVNKMVYKIFGAMPKDLYSEKICVHFGTDSAENLVANQRNCFINMP